jgi:hypothetical protein
MQYENQPLTNATPVPEIQMLEIPDCVFHSLSY